jgi:ESF2/ABP1 family protein
MSVRKRNEYLEDDDSENELEQGYQSDGAYESRAAISGPLSKRRKIENVSEDGSGLDSDEAVEETEPEWEEGDDVRQDTLSASPDNEDVKISAATTSTAKPSISQAHKHAERAQKAARRSGVIYISRVPPFMKPQTLKHFLAPHAPHGLGRLFLTPEDHVAHTTRVRKGGNKKKSFTDGWVEFISKSDAKIAAETLNGNIIGGKKGNFYHDDIWSMKYLKGFKWNHLTEQIANENAERAARLREEVRKTKQENKAFVEDIEKGKMLAGMEQKKKAREGGEVKEENRKARGFKQKSVQLPRKDEKLSEQAADLQKLIF